MGWHGMYRGDEAERRRWQNPEAVLKRIGLERGQTFIDVGCGAGFFAVPAARIVGDKGRVYGLDVDAEAIDRLRERAEKEHLANLVLSVGRAEDWISCEECADFVFFGIVLHDFGDPLRVLLNAGKMLKPEGCVVDVDWKKETMEIGPPVAIRFSERDAVGLLEKAGFRIGSTEISGRYHYLIMARRQR